MLRGAVIYGEQIQPLCEENCSELANKFGFEQTRLEIALRDMFAEQMKQSSARHLEIEQGARGHRQQHSDEVLPM